MRYISVKGGVWALLFLMLTIPFLYWWHFNPMTSFYQEWIALVLGCTFSALVIAKEKKLAGTISPLEKLGWLLIGGIVLQFLLSVYIYPPLLYLSYGLFALLMLRTGTICAQKYPDAIMVVAAGLFAGAFLNDLAGLAQYFNWRNALTYYVISKGKGYVFGNIAQANVYSEYSALGVASLFYLTTRYRRIKSVAPFFLAIMLFAIAVCGSRSAFIYLFMLSVALYLVGKKTADRFLLGAAYGILPVFILFNALSHFGVFQGYSQGTSIDRISTVSFAVRPAIWSEAISIISDHPLTGIGFESYGKEHFERSGIERDLIMEPYINNAHNIFIDIAVKMGVPIAMGVMWLSFLYLRSVVRASKDKVVELWFPMLCVLIIGVHAQLEFPLYYTYILSIFCFLAGYLWQHVPGQSRTINKQSINLLVYKFMILILLVGGANTLLVYRDAERFVQYPIGYVQAPGMQKLKIAAEHPITGLAFSAWMEANMQRSESVGAEVKDRWSDIVYRSEPTVSSIAFKLKKLSDHGDSESAIKLAENAAWMRAGEVDNLLALIGGDPHYAYLKEVIRNTREDWQIAHCANAQNQTEKERFCL